MELKIRENENGEYLMFHANNFEEGILFTKKNKLKQIQIRGTIGVEKKEVDLRLLESIENQINIVSLSGLNDGRTEVKNPESIYLLKSLEQLYLQEKQNFKIDISRFSKLKKLGVVYSTNIVNLNKSASIENLVITEAYPNEDLEFLQNLKTLKKIHIYKSPKLLNLKGIQSFPEIIELKLAFNTNIKNLKDLKEAKVEKLLVEKCKGLVDFSDLEGNSTIKELFITELDSLKFVPKMKKLEKIHFWECKDGDMNPLFESPTLRIVSITKDRKHYTHSQAQISEHFKNK